MDYKHRILPQTPTSMPDLPPNPDYVPPEDRKAVAEKQAVRKVRKVRRVKRSQVSQASRAAAKRTPVPANKGQQPRDRMGRFASFVSGTARGIVKTVKAADRIATNVLQDVTNTRPTRKRG